MDVGDMPLKTDGTDWFKGSSIVPKFWLCSQKLRGVTLMSAYGHRRQQMTRVNYTVTV